MTALGRSGGRAPRADCRCVCGSLVARVVPEGVELKCRRCKRTLLVPLEGARSTPVDVASLSRVAGELG